MFKNTTPLRRVIYAVIAGTALVCIAFTEIYILPVVYVLLPALHDLQLSRPYILDTLVTIVGMVLGIYFSAKAPSFEKKINLALYKKYKINKIIAHSAFAADTGIAFIDSEGTILSATQLMVELSVEKDLKDLIGKHYSSAYPKNILRLLSEVLEQASVTKTVSAVKISDWTTYSPQATSSAVLYVSPAFVGEKYKGCIFVIRSTADVQQAEDTVIYYQMHYQVLFDSLPVGAAEFRPAIAADGGVDGYMTLANTTIRRMLEGVPLPFQDPCSVVWPTFLQQNQLRDTIAKALTGTPIVRCEFFSPVLGKNFEVILSPLPGGRLLALVTDLTEPRMNEQKVLALSDQLQKTIASHAACMEKLQQDIQHFNQASVDLIETHLEQVGEVIEKIGEPEATMLCQASAGLHQTLNQSIKYYNVASLPFKRTGLIYPEELIARTLELLENRFPHISFEIGRLPGIVANRDILADILEQLLVSLARLPVQGDQARIEVGSCSDFIKTYLTISGWGFDTSPIFIETPTEQQLLDWTLTSDLDLAPVRAMISMHGGELLIGPTADNLGVQLAFSIGSPNQ